MISSQSILDAANEVLGVSQFSMDGDGRVIIGTIGPYLQYVSEPTYAAILARAQDIETAREEARQRLEQFPNLEPDQFWFIVRVAGYEQQLKDWVDTLTDPMEKAAASSKLEFAKFFERDHPFIEMARAALGMTTQELDSLWQYGATS